MALKVKISQILCICFILFLTNSMAADDTDLDYFGMRLFSELAKNNLQKNMVISPLSIQICIAMARFGATRNTTFEIDKGFGLSSQNYDDYYLNLFNQIRKYQNSSILKIANKVYIKKSYEVRKSFNELLTKKFFSPVDALNFTNSNAAAETINNWVEDKTNHLIKNLIQPQSLGANTRLVLVNAIHFKGEWLYKFPLKNTREMDFYLDETNTVKVPMMSILSIFRYGVMDGLGAQVLEIPYNDLEHSMLIILPDSHTRLFDLEERLRNMSLSDLTRDMYSLDVLVNIPKFKAEFEVELSDPLKNLGMGRMFSSDAGFEEILQSSKPVQMSKIVHKAFIEVNEAGTYATAANAAVFQLVSTHYNEFNANRPFIYFIKNEKNIIFSGIVNHFE